MSVKRPVLLFIVYCVGIVQYFISNIELYLRDCIRREIKAKEAEHASTLFIYCTLEHYFQRQPILISVTTPGIIHRFRSLFCVNDCEILVRKDIQSIPTKYTAFLRHDSV